MIREQVMMFIAFPSRTCRDSACVMIVIAAVVICGCGRGPGSPHPVDPKLAQQTLLEVMQGWKEGAALDAFRRQKPDIVVQDMDWHTGQQLSDFEILGEGRAVDANLYCDVRLTLTDSARNTTQKTVTYLVGTNPKRTVFRQLIP